MAATSQSISINGYKRAGGGGINMYQKGERVFGLDIHTIRVGGKKTGKDIIAPHIDIPPAGIKHFPWKQLDKFNRGIK